MKPLKPFLPLLVLLLHTANYAQQTTWSESFDIFEKGYWGDGSGNPIGDMNGVTKWSLDVSACTLTDAGDFIKTVSTSGGRMEAVDIDGEAIWISGIIDISACPNTQVSIAVSETGTSTNTNKYVKLSYKLNDGPETLFALNGENIGNFGSTNAIQSGLNGNQLQIIIRINNPNAGDACIFDNVLVSFDNIKPYAIAAFAGNETRLWIEFSEQVNQLSAENSANYEIPGIGMPVSAVLSPDQMTVILNFSTSFNPGVPYALNISGIADLNGNILDIQSIIFTYQIFKIEHIAAITSNELIIRFSHPLDLNSALTKFNYSVSDGIGNPSMAALLNDSTAKLTFTNHFSDEYLYLLSVDNLKDSYGTVLNGASYNFSFHRAKPFDLILNELMIDPSPAPNVLPPAKYIELYNRKAHCIDISGWYLQIGNNSPVFFPEYTIDAYEHLIICASAQLPYLKPYGKVMGVLSESQLTISSKAISLCTSEGLLMDYLKYDDTWYRNPEKANGGWSLERIDASNFCGDAQNWNASEDFKGGTPGNLNSVSSSNPDSSKPMLLSVQILSSAKLGLCFSKNMTDETSLDLSNFQLDEGINALQEISFSDTSRTTLILQFSEQFIDGQEQTIHCRNLKDFCGNNLDNASAKFTYTLIHPIKAYAESDKIIRLLFSEETAVVTAQTISNYLVDKGLGIPVRAVKHTTNRNEVFLEFTASMQNTQSYSIHIENVTDLDANPIKPCDLHFIYYSPSANDLCINEILFNPRPNGVDFVEIYNKSAFPIDLSKISIARRNQNQDLESVKILSAGNLLLEPYHFMAISTDSVKTKNDYPAIHYDKFLQISSMPSFNDDMGTVVLLLGDMVLDEFGYHEDMHFTLISNPEGVSLERIDPDKPTQTTTNWHSAAESYGYASPANQNSQFKKLSINIENEILVEPETFSPNNDGYDDRTFIRYKFNDPGYVANVNVYDSRGRLVKRLASNELLAVEGEFFWDGLHENGIKVTMGIYIIYFEVFNLKGLVQKYKKICVVAEKLN